MVETSEKITYSYGECSIAGKDNEGKGNEDSVSSFIPPSLRSSESAIKGIFCVADGFGGPGIGDAASRETVSLVKEVFTSGEYVNWARTRGIDPNDVSKVLHATVCQISLVINSYAAKRKAKMGTTLEALVFKGNRFYLAHAGNSRIYLMRKGIVYRLTQDHEVAESGEPEGSASNLLGFGREVTVDVFSDQVQPGDAFILCTDGITKTVTEDEIKFALANTETPQEAADKLARLANRRSGSDNISITIVSTARPGRETRPPIKMEEILPKPVALEGPSKTWRIAFIGAMALVVIALGVVGYLVFLRKEPKPNLVAGWDAEKQGVEITINRIPKDSKYYVYRQQKEPFRAQSETPPTDTEWTSPHALTTDSPTVIDETVEEGKTYYYTAYRQITTWTTKLDRSSEIIAEPVTIAITGTGEVVEPSGKDKTRDEFREAVSRYGELERKYGSGYSGGSGDLLMSIREYNSAIDEIDALRSGIKRYDYRSDLVLENKTPKILIKDLGILRETMIKSMEKDGIVPYLAAARTAAIQTDFRDSSLEKMFSIGAELKNEEWADYRTEFKVMTELYGMNKDIERLLVRFVPPKSVEHVVKAGARTLDDILKIYYSNEKAASEETKQDFYAANPDMDGTTRFDVGAALVIPKPDFERGGEKIAGIDDGLKVDYYDHAISYAKAVSDSSLSMEYTDIVKLYEIKAAYWELVANNSRSLREELENLDTVRASSNPYYRDSQVRSALRRTLADLGTVKPGTDEKLKALTEERKRLGVLFETIDPEDEADKFAEAVRDFEKLKEEVNAETGPEYDALKETVASLQETVDFITGKVSGEHVVQLAQADKLVDEVGDISAVQSGYEEAISKLEEAAGLYEKALESIASAEDRKSVSAKVEKIRGNITLLRSRAEGGFKPVRWGKEIDELSLPELLVYLRKLTNDTDELAESLKEELPDVYRQEVETATKRTKDLQELASKRIIRRLEPGGPEFDARNFEKGMAEFKYLTFAMTSVVDDPAVRKEIEAGLDELEDSVKDGILINHLTYEGAYKEFATIIHNAVSTALKDINDGFVDALGQTEIKARIFSNEGDKYFEPIREFVDSITDAMAGHERGRSGYFVEVLTPDKEDDALALARVLAKDEYPLAGMKLMTGESYLNGRSYRIAVGWYGDKKDAEEAAKRIERIPEAFRFISSIDVRKTSDY